MVRARTIRKVQALFLCTASVHVHAHMMRLEHIAFSKLLQFH